MNEPPRLRPAEIENGSILHAKDGVRYRVEHCTERSLTLRRAIRKLRGKAARRADKRARQQGRKVLSFHDAYLARVADRAGRELALQQAQQYTLDVVDAQLKEGGTDGPLDRQ